MFVRVTCTWALSLWSLLLICTWDATALEVVRQGSPCGPNEVPWPSEDGAFHCEAFEEAWKRAEAFLNDNMPPWDLLNRGTLQLGLLPATVTQALQVRQNFSWAAEVPEEIWLNYVLPYASVNEARTDWRRLLFEALKIDAAKRSLAEVTQLVNEKLWSAVRNDTTIVFKAQQTPLIYDTMSAIAFGYASCTGLSIMFLDALRSVGVPARLVGTPAWHGTFADGNHNWVEIWLGHGSGLFGEAWTFLEASPAGPGEHLLNPCDKWFCNPSHFDGKTMSFAAKFDREKEKFNYYPMAWDMENKDIPGVNRTDFYNSICSKC
ncbi:TGc domain-containing protein [Durusdinium trenchii]|uniref:TGc domain-containing protein n=1 Tax=Durusdinium trenchii TaxID=1381693 RepID=A0ABP0P2H5_9DINO